MRNLGYSLLATALRTDAGAQPPGFTAATEREIIRKLLVIISHKSSVYRCCVDRGLWSPLVVRTMHILLFQINSHDLPGSSNNKPAQDSFCSAALCHNKPV